MQHSRFSLCRYKCCVSLVQHMYRQWHLYANLPTTNTQTHTYTQASIHQHTHFMHTHHHWESTGGVLVPVSYPLGLVWWSRFSSITCTVQKLGAFFQRLVKAHMSVGGSNMLPSWQPTSQTIHAKAAIQSMYKLFLIHQSVQGPSISNCL